MAAAAPPGLRLAVEILPRTCLGRTSGELMAIIADLDPSRVGACLDANHANLRENLAGSVRSLGTRLLTLHVSDNDGVDERHWMPGRGIINWVEFLRILDASGYNGAFVYETARKKGEEIGGLIEIRANFCRLLEMAFPSR
jgi:sugar phosphate isomerase/epimerase